MERDSLISYGASGLLRERLCDSSDAYNAIFCYHCGTLAIVDVSKKTKEEAMKCQTCNEKKFGVLVIPYAFKLLIHLLWAVHYNPRLILRPITEAENDDPIQTVTEESYKQKTRELEADENLSEDVAPVSKSKTEKKSSLISRVTAKPAGVIRAKPSATTAKPPATRTRKR